MKLSTVTLFKNLDVDSDKIVHMDGKLLKEYQQYIVSIAQDIIEVCEKEDIVYHLTGGTALGAIRHKGFIPWDDDMDIDILGDDFERFLQCFEAMYGEKYWIHTWEKSEYGMVLARIRLKGSICRAREDIDNDECGFYVDLFRIENTFDNFLLRKAHGIICMGMGFLLSCRNFYKSREMMLELSSNNKEIRKIFLIKIRIGKLLSFCSVKRWAMMTQWCYALCKNKKSKYVSVPAGRNHYFGEMYLRKDFVETITCEFEGRNWKVPKEIDAYLSHMYGDYMKLPPEDKREKHVLLELKFPNKVQLEEYDEISNRIC